jgi:uncharacterized protein (TIGR00304 family)
MDVYALITIGFVLITVGVLIVIVVVLASRGKTAKKEGESEAKVKGGGVIMIGPIPIIFGNDKKSVKTVIVLALALTIALIVWYYMMLR